MGLFDKGYFFTRYAYDPNRDRIWKELCKWIQKDIPQDASILDIGAGYCSFINNIKAKHKYAVDIYPDFRKFASSNVVTYIARCSNLSMFKDDALDVVFASNLFEHLEMEEFELTLKEIRRILKMGGCLIILQPNFRYCFRNYFDDYTHRLVFTDVSLCDCLHAMGFKVIKMIKRLVPFSMDTRLPKSPFLLRIYLRLPYRPFAAQMYCVAIKEAGHVE